jgi:RNA polymerase sigma-70 factor (ECF subfamily)
MPAGDHSVEELFAEHSTSMVERARRLLRSEADAEDALQEAMLALVRAPHVLGAVESLGAWLVALVHRKCVDIVREDRRRKARESEAVRPGPGSPPDAGRAGGLDSAAREELLRAVAGAVGRLPPDLKVAFVGNAVDDKTFRELSRETGVPMGTLMERKARAVGLVRGELERAGYV